MHPTSGTYRTQSALARHVDSSTGAGPSLGRVSHHLVGRVGRARPGDGISPPGVVSWEWAHWGTIRRRRASRSVAASGSLSAARPNSSLPTSLIPLPLYFTSIISTSLTPPLLPLRSCRSPLQSSVCFLYRCHTATC